MSKFDKAVELVDSIFDEGFDSYSKMKAAERHIDYLLDMCGVPHHRKKLKEDMDPLSLSMNVTGRPYDHPRKIRVKPVIDVNDEVDVDECGPIEGEPYPGDFEGASPNNLPEEEPAKEATPQKKQNKINHVPNQDASGILSAIKGEMMKESSSQYKAYFDSMLKKYGVSSPAQLPREKKREFFNAVDKGWKGKKESVREHIKGEIVDEVSRLKIGSAGAKRVMRNVKKLKDAYQKKTGKKLSGGQAYRMLPDKFK